MAALGGSRRTGGRPPGMDRRRTAAALAILGGMSPSNRRFVVVALAVAVWAVVTPHMWRDLRARAPDQVRGPKWLWWIASANLTGSAAYWLVGRKDPD